MAISTMGDTHKIAGKPSGGPGASITGGSGRVNVSGEIAARTSKKCCKAWLGEMPADAARGVAHIQLKGHERGEKASNPIDHVLDWPV